MAARESSIPSTLAQAGRDSRCIHQLVALEPAELLQLLKAAKQHSRRAHAMVLLAVRHGMRCSEVTGLRVGHVNLREGWIRVERLKGSLTTVQNLERHPGQPLLDEQKVLSAWLRERNDDGSDFLFNSSHGGRLDRSSFYRLWRALGEAAGLPAAKLHPHVAKHTLGALLARQNASAFIDSAGIGPQVHQQLHGLLTGIRRRRRQGSSAGIHGGVLTNPQNAPLLHKMGATPASESQRLAVVQETETHQNPYSDANRTLGGVPTLAARVVALADSAVGAAVLLATDSPDPTCAPPSLTLTGYLLADSTRE